MTRALLVAFMALLPLSAQAGEFCIVTTDDVTLARLATEMNREPQVLLEQQANGYLKRQAQNYYKAEVQRLREACRAGQYEDAEQCAALRARRK